MKFASGLEVFPAPLAFWGILGTGLVSGLIIVALIESKPNGAKNASSAQPQKRARPGKVAKPILKARQT